MYGIPNMKLDKEKGRFAADSLMEAEGIRFICNANVGENVEPQIFLKEYAATVICTGATQPRDLPIEGRNLPGVHFAMEYLTASTKAVLAGEDSPLHARDKDVVVIGGATRAPTASARRCARAAAAWRRSKFFPSRRRTAPRTIPGRSGPRSTGWIWPGGGRGPVRCRPQGLPEHHQEIHRRSGLPASASSFSVEINWEKKRQGPVHPARAAGTEKVRPAQLVLLAMGFSDRSRHCSRRSTSPAMRAATSRPSMRNIRPACRACSPPATAAGARASWSGRSTRVGAPARECDRYLMGSTDLP